MVEPVDLSNLRELTEGDENMERMLFAEFISSAERYLLIMEENCLNGENNSWRTAAHALKGTSMNLGADGLSALCKMAQDKQAAGAQEKEKILSKIKSEYAVVKALLDKEL